MMKAYLLYTVFVIVWIIGVYFLFNRKRWRSEKVVIPPSQMDMIAVPQESKIRVVFDQTDHANLDIKSLADLTVKYSDLLTGTYQLPQVSSNAEKLLTEKKNGSGDQEKEKESLQSRDLDLTDYLNIFTLKKLNHQ